MSDTSESEDSNEPIVKKKRTRKIVNKQRNKSHEELKARRSLGQAYTTSKGKKVKAKSHTIIDSCCIKKCYENASFENQVEVFDSFYRGQSKSLQDAYLSRCVEKMNGPKKQTVNLKRPRENLWNYFILVGGTKIKVCQKFLLNLFQISEKRVRIVQSKILSGDSFEEKRGSHKNRPRNISENTISLMGEHLKSIPHDESHYCKEKTNLLYFDNCTLTIKTLFDLFKEYYKEKTGLTVKMSYNTYYEYFTTKFSYAVQKPKTDVCDFCVESKNKLKVDPNDACKPLFELHKRKASKRKEIRDGYIAKSKEANSKVLTVEFDYSQNHPIPKLNVNNQFYKRMFWLYCFNIHVFNDDSSFLYAFTECDGVKNPNSVISFLYDCLKKQIQKFPNVSTVVLLSDATGGQNRNFLMSKFTSWFARVFKMDLIQIFPVRGHSFSQCDRNFGLVRNKIKNQEMIGNPKPYLTAMVQCREKPSPFEVVLNPELLQNWEPFLNNLFRKKPISGRKIPFTIMKYVIIKSLKNGAVLCSKSYLEQYDVFSYWRPNQEIGDFLTPNTQRSPYPEVNQLKVNDVRGLYRFLQEDDVAFLEKMISQSD